MSRPVAYLVVFVSSCCTLILELVAGRILAPFIGVSLYTWTSIIGVVLAGISLGNYLGGRIADRWPERRTLGVLLLAGGLASLEAETIFLPCTIKSKFNLPRTRFVHTPKHEYSGQLVKAFQILR